MAIRYSGIKPFDFGVTKHRALPPTTVTWITPAGALADRLGGATVSVNLQVNVLSGKGDTTFEVVGGELPGGLSLSTNNGLISGQVANVAGTFEFIVRATNNRIHADRAFSMTVIENFTPVWGTSAGTLGTYGADEVASISLSASDPDGSTILYSLASGALPPGWSLNGAGVISGTSSSTAATYNFSVRASDGILYSDQAFSIVFDPTAALLWTTPAGSLGTVYDTQGAYSLALEAFNTDGDEITYSLQSGALPGGLTLSNTGVISGNVPSVIDSQVYNFTVRASDGTSINDRAFGLTIVQDKPVWQTASGSIGSVNERAAGNFSVSAADHAGGEITYTLTSGALPIGLSLANTGAITGTASTVGADTAYNFTITATGTRGTATRTFSITVVNVPTSPPVWVTDNSTPLVDQIEGTDVLVTLQATDPQGLPLTFSAGTVPYGLTFDGATGVLSGTLSEIVEYENTGGTSATFGVTVTNGDTSSFRSFVLKNNEAYPVWETPSGLLTIIDEETTIANVAVVATCPLGDTVTYTRTSGTLPPGITLNADGTFSGTTDVVVGDQNYTFSVRADNGHATINRSFTITVNDVPASAPVWQTTQQLGSFVEKTAITPIVLTATDPAGLPLTYTLRSSLPSGLSWDAETHTLSGTPTNVTSNTVGNFVVRVANDESYRDRTFYLTVTPLPVPVWVSSDTLATQDESSEVAIQLQATGATSYTLAPFNSLPTGLTMTSDGFISGILPGVDSNTYKSFQIRAHNEEGFSQKSFKIYINQVAVLPVWETAAGNLGSQDEGSAFEYQLGAYDLQDRTISFSKSAGTLPSGVTLNTTTGLLSGTLPVISTSSVTYNFTIRVTNVDGSVDRNFSIVVQNVPVVPEWQSYGDIGTYAEGQAVSVRVTATDPLNRSISYARVSGSLPTGITLRSDGLLYGTMPKVQQDTTYNFTIRASNIDGYSDQPFSFYVTNTPALPLWNTAANLGSASEGASYSKQVTATGADGIPVTYGLSGDGYQAFPGTLSISNSGLITGTLPRVQTTEVFSFAITAITDEGYLDREFTLTVNNVATAPTWTTTAGSLGTVNERTVSALNVAATHPDLAVEYFLISGALPPGISLDQYTGNLYGTFDAVTTNTSYSFVIGAKTSENATTTNRSFSVTVAQVATGPTWSTAAGSLGSFSEGDVVNLSFSATHPEGLAVTYSVIGTLPGGLSLNGSTGALTGTLTYTSAASPASFSIRASTSEGFTDRAFTMTIANTPVAPTWNTAAGSLGSFMSGANVSITVSATALVAITYTVTAGSLPAGLSLNSSTGAITGTLTAVVTETVSNFTITASSSEGDTPRAFSITAQPSLVDDAYWNNVSLLLNADTNTVTHAFNASATTVTMNKRLSSVATSTVQKKFGTHAYYFDGSNWGGTQAGSWASQANPPNSNIGTQNFTAEMWIRPETIVSNGAMTLISHGTSATNANRPFMLSLMGTVGSQPSGIAISLFGSTGNISYESGTVAASFPANTWVHVAVVRDGTKLMMFRNGVMISNTTLPANHSLTFSTTNSWEIGHTAGGSQYSNPYKGYMDDIRVTVGAARYTGTTVGQTYFNPASWTERFDYISDTATGPQWVTNSGVIANSGEGSGISVQLNAIDPDGDPVTYEMANNTSLPSGLTLSNTGLISGNLPEVSQDTTYDFEIAAVNSEASVTRSFSITNVDLGAFPVTTSATLVGRYDAAGYVSGSTSWNDISGNNNHATVSGLTKVTNFTGSGITAPSTILTGSTTSTILWPTTILPSTYTVIFVTAWNPAGTSNAGSPQRRRIMAGSGTNWLSGHYNLTGTTQTGVAYHGGWLTQVNQNIGDNFFVSVDQNTMYRAKKTTLKGTVGSVTAGASASARLTVNVSVTTNETSDFRIAEVLVYNGLLNQTDVTALENYLYGKYGLS